LEPFYYPVWDMEVVEQKKEEITYVLFDYKARNPLNYEATTYVIKEPDKKE